MDILLDYFLIQVKSKRQDTIQHGKLDLILQDQGLRNDAGYTYEGIILQVPKRLSSKTQMRLTHKSSFNVPTTSPTIKDLPTPIAEIGDKVYFTYNAIGDAFQDEEGRGYFIHYKDVIAVVRRGEIVSQANHVILDIIQHEPKQTASGIILELEGRKETDYAKVAACRPEHNIAKGDIVLIKNDADATYEIEGKEVYVCHIDDVVAVCATSTDFDVCKN